MKSQMYQYRLNAFLTGPGFILMIKGALNFSFENVSLFLTGMILTISVTGQNCNVEFPGTSSKNYSSACGLATITNLNLGTSAFLGDGDVFTFDAPNTITIDGNVDIKAEGSGKIIIPEGVTVIVDGNFKLDRQNGGCESGNGCTFEIVVNGKLIIDGNFHNKTTTLIWSGTGTVAVNDNFENSGGGCMECGAGSCPAFPSGDSCKDNGTGCAGNFCVDGNYGNNSPLGGDLNPPVISNCPANQVVGLTGSDCGKKVNWTSPTAADDVGVVSFISNHNPGDLFPLGTTTVTYTATDGSGNQTTCNFDIIVNDNSPPVISGCPADIVITLSTPDNEMPVAWTEPTASDNCSLSSFTGDFSPGDTFPAGITVVTYTATDEAGNTAECSFNVEVTVNEAPVASAVSANANSGQPVRICLQATDPDGGNISLETVNYASTNGQIDNIDGGALCFTYTSNEDFEGNETFTVTICDDQNPSACSEVEVQIIISPDRKLVIYKAFTPDNDKINDVWQIGNIEYYPDNQVKIFDRWGSLVYKAIGYNNEDIVWDGSSTHSMAGGKRNVPSGTYFYTIDLGNGQAPVNGFIELVQ